MFKIEDICEKISDHLAQELNFDMNKKCIVNYGIFAFIQMVMCIILVIIFGVIFNVLIEALIISFTTSILRKSSGGAHASSPKKCAIIGTISNVGMGLIAKNIYASFTLTILIGIIVFVWSYYIVHKLAPVDSKAKPIKSIKKRNSLKKSSIVILSVYLIIVMINILYYYFMRNSIVLVYTLCIYIGLLWQIFSLTKYGYLILGKFN